MRQPSPIEPADWRAPLAGALLAFGVILVWQGGIAFLRWMAGQ